MAKYTLNLYDPYTGEKIKTYTRAFIPTGLYIRFQQTAEKAEEKYANDNEFFEAIKGVFLETFPELTEEEYYNNTDVKSVLKLWAEIINKSTELADNEKN